MNLRRITPLCLGLGLALVLGSTADAAAPVEPARDSKVTVDGHDCFVYHAPVAAFAGFDLTEPAEVEIECTAAIEREVFHSHKGRLRGH